MKQFISKIQDNNCNNPHLGLFHGKMGICLCYYHIAQKTGDVKYQQMADDLLDNICENLDTSSTDFENGLAGIGWGIEYLLENKFVNGDADEILEEIDIKIFKALNEGVIYTADVPNGLAGYLFYLISRLKKPFNPDSESQYICRELLILVVNKIDELFSKQISTITKVGYFDILWTLPVLIFGLTKVYELNVYSEKIKLIVNQWLMYIEEYLPSVHSNRLYLAISLKYIFDRIPSERLRKSIDVLLHSIDYKSLKFETDPESVRLRDGRYGIIWLLYQAVQLMPESTQSPQYDEFCHTFSTMKVQFREILNNDYHSDKEFGLANGIYGIALMESVNPIIFSND